MINEQAKKILYLDYRLAYLYSDIDKYVGGASVELYHWIKGFNKIGVRVGVLTLKGTNEYITKKLDFDLIESWDENAGIPKIRFIYYILPSFYKSIKNYDPDYVVQETAGRNTAIMAIIGKILGKKFIYRIASDQEVDERLNNHISKFSYRLFNLGLKLADFIFCQNKYQEAVLRKKFPNKKIFLIYNPYNIVNSGNILEKNERAYIAWIGSFMYLKNIPALLEVVKKHPEMKFKIAGKSYKGYSYSETESAIEELKKLSNVEFVGLIKNEQITSFLEKAYALINTSQLEGFSNTFIEAWSVGTPVISTKNVNPDNIISKFGLGIVEDSYEKLSDAIAKIVNMSEDEYHALSQRCINYVKENHDSKTLAEKFFNYIEQNS